MVCGGGCHDLAGGSVSVWLTESIMTVSEKSSSTAEARRIPRGIDSFHTSMSSAVWFRTRIVESSAWMSFSWSFEVYDLREREVSFRLLESLGRSASRSRAASSSSAKGFSPGERAQVPQVRGVSGDYRASEAVQVVALRVRRVGILPKQSLRLCQLRKWGEMSCLDEQVRRCGQERY